MTTPTNPTARPWVHIGAVYGDYGTRHEEIVDAAGLVVCGEFGGPDAEQAALIVRAVNVHDDLVEALAGVLERLPEPLDDRDMSPSARVWRNCQSALAKATGDE